MYFRLNTLRLCKNLINAVNSRQFMPFEEFPASQRVTYKYYTGRLAIFDENYVRTLNSSSLCLNEYILLWVSKSTTSTGKKGSNIHVLMPMFKYKVGLGIIRSLASPHQASLRCQGKSGIRSFYIYSFQWRAK